MRVIAASTLYAGSMLQAFSRNKAHLTASKMLLRR